MNRDNNHEIEKTTPETEAAEETAAEQTEPAAGEEPAEKESTRNFSEENTDSETEEADGANEPEEKKKKGKLAEKVGAYTKSTKFRRGEISTAFTAGFLIVVILINVIVSVLAQRYPSMNLDLTKNKVNTLSTQAAEIVSKVNVPTTIYIMATQAQTKGDQLLSEYGIKYSQVGELAEKIAEKNTNIKVEYMDLDKNPTFASTYKNDNLVAGDVLVKTDKRYRVLAYTDLFNVQYGSDGVSTETYSMVDSALASALNSVIADTVAIAAFDTGHSEQLETTTYQKLLANNSFETKDFNLLTDAIPDNTRLVVLGCPTTDYTDAELKKLDTFLSSSAIAGDRSLLITFHPSQQAMPKLSAFLKEWGIEVPQAVVVESDQSKYYTDDPSYILSTVQTGLSLGGQSDYGYFTTPQSNPINLLFETRETKTTYSLAKSNDSCYLVDNNTKADDTPQKAAYNTAVLSQDKVQSGTKEYKANVIALGSTTMFAGEILGASTFGNAKYVVDLSRYATGTTNSATAITETSVQTNVSDITLSAEMSVLLGIGVFTLLIPLLVVVAGVCVYRKRRRL
ncbi:Gldg family protein [Clostridium sp. KNHs216]|uniref:Gldg family protein n=1 Tax=Clostridium sp. KNHs216 TaxID=1550235 RepID=UPI00117047F6|nr:Gldg family protein [Clostridium sp. KNHs216]TQI67638.1 ABC transporter family protein [Clostridium sp. KNHs216]